MQAWLSAVTILRLSLVNCSPKFMWKWRYAFKIPVTVLVEKSLNVVVVNSKHNTLHGCSEMNEKLRLDVGGNDLSLVPLLQPFSIQPGFWQARSSRRRNGYSASFCSLTRSGGGKIARKIVMCGRSGFDWPDVGLQENRWCARSGGLIMLHEFQLSWEISLGLFVALLSTNGRSKGHAADTDSLPGDLFFRDGNIVLHKIHGSYSVKFSAHEQEVNCVDFQSGLIVSGSRDRTAKVSSKVPAAAGAAAEVTSEVLCHGCLSVSRTLCEPYLVCLHEECWVPWRRFVSLKRWLLCQAFSKEIWQYFMTSAVSLN